MARTTRTIFFYLYAAIFLDGGYLATDSVPPFVIFWRWRFLQRIFSYTCVHKTQRERIPALTASHALGLRGAKEAERGVWHRNKRPKGDAPRWNVFRLQAPRLRSLKNKVYAHDAQRSGITLIIYYTLFFSSCRLVPRILRFVRSQGMRILHRFYVIFAI